MNRIPAETEVRATHARRAEHCVHRRAMQQRAARMADSHGVWPTEEVPEHTWQRCACGMLVYVVCKDCVPVHEGCAVGAQKVRPA